MTNKITQVDEFTEDGTLPNSNEEKVEVEAGLENEPSAEPETSETGEESSELNTELDTTEQPETAKVKIGEQEFTPEELQEIVERGTKVKAYEQKMPGFKIDSLMADYTKKSQLLAEIQRRSSKSSQAQETQEKIEELGIDTEQIKTFEKVAKHLGFIRHEDIVQDTVEAQKATFIQAHPEYGVDQPEGKNNWNHLMQEFSIYNWQAHPDRVHEWLETAHSVLAAQKHDIIKNKTVAQAVQTKTAVAKAAAMTGGATATTKPAVKVNNQELVAKYKAAGWSEQDIKDLIS